MSIESTFRDAIDSVLTNAISGLTIAPYIPRSVTHYDMPIAVIFPKSATYETRDITLTQVTRTWEITLLINAIGTGLETTNELDMYEFMQTVQDALLARRRLEQTDYINNMRMVRDSGFSTITTGDGQYEGIIFEISIEYTRAVEQTK